MTASEGAPYKGPVPKELAALLAEEGSVSAEVLERALVRQREAGGALDTALLELGALDEEALRGALSRASGLPPAPPEAWTQTDARARRVFPSRVAERHGLAPFRLDGRELSLVATHPVDLGLLDEISFMLSLHLTAHVGPEWRVRELIHRLYGGALPPRLAALAAGRPPVPPLPAYPEAPAAPEPPAAAPDEANGLDFSDDADAARPGPAPREPPALPAVFEAVEGDALAAALEQAVEAVELGFLDDDAAQAAPPEAAAAELPDEPARRVYEPPPPPAALDRSAPPHWTLEQARATLDAAGHRDEVVLAALRYARDFFEFAALFAVARDAIAGHDALGIEEGTRELARSVALYASEPGVLRTVMETGGSYLGPVTREPGTEAILRGLDRGSPRTVLVFPVLVRGRIVCLLYADNGEAPVSPRRLGDLLTLLACVGAAFERVLRDQKKRAGAAPEVPETWRTREPARLPQPDPTILGEPSPPPVPAADEPVQPPPPEPEAEPLPLEAYLPPAAEAEPAATTEAATEPAPEPEPEPEPAAEPAPAPEHPGDELEVATAAAIEAAEAEVDVAIDEEPPDTTDEVPLPPPEEPLGQVADRVFASDPSVSAAAVQALAARRRDPGQREATDRLRRGLLSGLSARTAAAARALAAIRDVESVPLLVQVLEQADPVAAEAVAGALRAVTMQPLGKDPMRWLLWWKENRGRGRAEWVFGALTHPLKEVRAAAAAELSGIAPPPVEYDPDWDLPKLQQAAADWAAWWARSGLVI